MDRKGTTEEPFSAETLWYAAAIHAFRQCVEVVSEQTAVRIQRQPDVGVPHGLLEHLHVCPGLNGQSRV